MFSDDVLLCEAYTYLYIYEISNLSTQYKCTVTPIGEGEVAMKILGIKKHKSGPSVKNIETNVNKDFLERRSLM